MPLKKKFTQPKIYIGGVDIALWDQLSNEEQSNALSKDWYVYYKFIDGDTDTLIGCLI
ncbi:hypothetical protein [Flavobacterium psychrotrophum]|uniref:hypothetical protein n=1 Tax=Flavobacterium psychrotrophum TaxID=2294119 RepID=UPI0013C4D558|nr:hypothetical protein [Flavobacterium psychrotrophum]